VCGEQVSMIASTMRGLGSPPRVRGTEEYAQYRDMDRRITPACAGNSSTCWMRLVRDWDHPRVCGEQSARKVAIDFPCGSPPRVRGTGRRCRRPSPGPGITPACAGNRHRAGRACRHLGITPACAGNSPARWRWRVENQDHPRVCGEQSGTDFTSVSIKGSPPRVRGTASSRCGHLDRDGITPACAGNRQSHRPG